MARRPSIEVDGLDELRRELRRVKNTELNDEMKRIHVELARQVLDLAEPNVPTRTGALRESVRAAGTVRDAIGRAGNRSVPYAAAVHWGWPAKGIPSRPFMTDAAAALERDIVDRYDDQVARMLNRVIGY